MSIKNLPADYLLAAQQGDIDKVKTCLALGVDINTCDRQGKTAITLASLYQQYACVQALIDAGADIIMLPYFKTVAEVTTFLSLVNGRVKTLLLLIFLL